YNIPISTCYFSTVFIFLFTRLYSNSKSGITTRGKQMKTLSVLVVLLLIIISVVAYSDVLYDDEQKYHPEEYIFDPLDVELDDDEYTHVQFRRFRRRFRRFRRRFRRAGRRFRRIGRRIRKAARRVKKTVRKVSKSVKKIANSKLGKLVQMGLSFTPAGAAL